MKNIVLDVWDSKNTVFTVNELSQLIEHSSESSLRLKISNYKKRGYIEKVVKWIYTLPKRKIDSFELVNKIYSPSYISFFSALYYHWVIFQPTPGQVSLAYKKSEVRVFKELDFEVHLKSLKQDVLLNNQWLIFKDTYTIASPERAFLDTIYLCPNTYFDNTDLLDIKKIKNLLVIYKREKMMIERVKKYFPNI
jgi:predicted transcriptional regulator of viral defense system